MPIYVHLQDCVDFADTFNYKAINFFEQFFSRFSLNTTFRGILISGSD